MQESTYLAPKDFCAQFGVAPSTTYRWLREGRIRSLRLGRRYLIPREELERIEREGLREPEEGTSVD